MRTMLSLLFVAGFATTFTIVVANAAWSASVNPAIPDAEWTAIDGRTIRLEEFRGDRPVYLKFWASWCGTCLKEMPHLESVHQNHGDDIAVIAVNLGINDDREAVINVRDEFLLNMPIIIDRDGRMAQEFDLIATPYHVLLDRDLRVVHAEYSASDSLDEKIRQLAAGHGGELEAIETGMKRKHRDDRAAPVPATPGSSGGLKALFFVATWCHWYLEDTRPAMSRNCIDAQHVVNSLVRRHPDLEWIGVASRMWTGQEELDAYRERFDVKHPLAVDRTNDTIQHHEIRQFPSLIVVQEGEEVLRIQDFGDPEKVARKFEDAVSHAAGSLNEGAGDQDAIRGPYKIAAAPARQSRAPSISVAIRRSPSIHRSQASELTI